jgi:hypothetical protein
MKVLVACEESQEVCKAFRATGHEAYSCDIVPCSGGHPEWHIQDDVLKHFNDGWDLMIAHPPCTYLANSGISWLFNYKGKSLPSWEVFGLTGYTGDNSERVNIKRFIKMHEAAEFFSKFLLADIPKIAIENPIPHKYAYEWIVMQMPFEKVRYAQYDQIIQPWMFNHPEQKATCLWLKRLPKLYPTSTSLNCQNNKTHEKMISLPDRERQRLHYLPPSADRQKKRSKTFPGIAQAFADQWGGMIPSEHIPNSRGDDRA